MPAPAVVTRAAPAKKTTTAPTHKTPAQPNRTKGHTAPKATGNLAAVISYALAQTGKPYRYGAAGPTAYDCSGLLQAAFARIGVSLPHQSEGIAHRGRVVPRSQLRPGDVLHWPGHVALALSATSMIHASKAGVPVKVSAIHGNPQVIRIVG